MTTQAGMWTASGTVLALALVAGVAEWRRSRRRNLDDPGWMPRRGIQVAGLFAMLVLTALAVRA